MIADFFFDSAEKKILSGVVKKLYMLSFLIYSQEYYYSNIIIPMVITKILENKLLGQQLAISTTS